MKLKVSQPRLKANKDNYESSKRKEIAHLIEELRKTNKNVDYNIFKALDNINLNCVLGTKKDGVYSSFLDKYNKMEEKNENI